MQIRIAVVCLCGLMFAASAAEAQFRVASTVPAEAYNVELGAMLWYPTPTLLIQTGALAGFTGTEVDFVGEFGIERKRFTEWRTVVKPGRKHKIRFNYVPFRYSEDATLQRTITFGGQTFPISLPATAELKWDMWRFGYEWDFVSRSRGFLGVIGELKYNKVSAEVAAAGFATALADANAPVPTVGVIGRGYLHQDVSVTAEFTGFHLPDFIRKRFTEDELDVDVSDFDLYVTANASRNFGVQAGYRTVKADYLVDDDAGDLEMKGWYFGAVVRF